MFFWFSNCDFSFRNDGHITRPTKQITARLGHTRLPASDISLRHRIENLGPVTCEAWRISWRHTYIYIYLYLSMYTFVHMYVYMYLYMFMDMHIACASILSTGGTSQPTIQGNTQTNVVTNQQCNGNTNLEDMIWGHNTDCKRITIRGIATNMLEARLRWNGQLLEGCILMLSILCHSRITSVFLVNKKDTAKTATQ